MAVLGRKPRKPREKQAVLTVSADTMRKLTSLKRYKGKRIAGVEYVCIDDVWHPVRTK